MILNYPVEQLLLWIVVLPLAGALVNGLLGRMTNRSVVSAVAVGAVSLSFAMALVVFVSLVGMDEGSRIIRLDLYEWFSVSFQNHTVPIRVAFVVDELSGIMLLMVTGIGTLIHLYSTDYMSEDPSLARFFSYLNLFTASMLILILASSIPVMFVGWEGVGLCSYLLIGFWYDNRDYARAGRKAFVVNRIGDFGVLIATFLLVGSVYSFEFSDINEAAVSGASGLVDPFHLFLSSDAGVGAASIASVAVLFLFLGCTGKSAQVPLYVWLPDAMAGPTPVSALIHAATMVTSGVYLCCRLSPLFWITPNVMAVIAVVGTVTALVAACVALVQVHMKKILAYSTVSQLGFMFAAVGCGAFRAGIFHVFTHAFFKACLFLGAGAVMHAVHAHGDADVRKLGGLRKTLPTVHWTFLVSCLAIAGVPFFSGFFSKDEILLGALEASHYFVSPLVAQLVFVGLLAAAVMTAFYMFRLYFLTFHGSYRSGEGVTDGYDAHPHRPGPAMAWPLMILGVGAVTCGYLGLPHALHLPNLWGHWLEPAVVNFSSGQAEGPFPWIAMVSGTVAMLAGVGLAYALYKSRGLVPASDDGSRKPFFHRLLMDAWRVDRLYDASVVKPVHSMARFSSWVDANLVDGLLARVTSGFVRAGGFVITRLQTGKIYAYGLTLAVGLLAVVWWFSTPHIDVDHEVEGHRVTWTVEGGYGYRYRWDAEADGEFESDWDDRTDFSHAFVGDGTGHVHGLALMVGPSDGSHGNERVIELPEAGKTLVLWELDGVCAKGRPPSVTTKPHGVSIRPNGCSSSRLEQGMKHFSLGPGNSALLETLNVTVVSKVSAVVEARSALGGYTRQHVHAFVIPPRKGEVREQAHDGMGTGSVRPVRYGHD